MTAVVSVQYQPIKTKVSEVVRCVEFGLAVLVAVLRSFRPGFVTGVR